VAVVCRVSAGYLAPGVAEVSDWIEFFQLLLRDAHK
jgi:hypothetical protein